MSSTSGTLTAEERRQRRLARILGDSDGRINKILSGPSGEENRKAPAMEGGDFRSIAPSEPENTKSPSPTIVTNNSKSGRSIFSNKFLSVFLIATFAIVCQILNFNDMNFNVILPWIIGYCMFEFFFVSKTRSLNADNQFMQMLFNVIPVEHSRSAMFQRMGYFTSLGKSFASDSGFMVSCYIITQSISTLL